jgi:hypothetical protein
MRKNSADSSLDRPDEACSSIIKRVKVLSSGYRDAGDAAFAIIRTKTYVGFIVFPCVFLYFRCVGLVAALLLKSRSSAPAIG